MIKRFIKRVEKSASDAWITILLYIDDKLDDHDRKINEHKKRMDDYESKLNKFERSFDSTKAEVDSNADRKKGYYKTIVNAVIIGIIGYILARLGMG